MSNALLRRSSSLVAPHLCLALLFCVSWWAPQSSIAVSAADAGWIMLLESALLLASILVGGFVQVSYVFLPLILLATLVWLVSVGRAGISWALAGFVWGVIAAFLEGLRAQRGEFGMARENIEHPHRRYDRVMLVFLAALPVLALFWVIGHPAPAIVWGSLYFVLLTAADSFLRGAIDRIPRALLRRMQAKIDPEVSAKLGLCADCHYVQAAIPVRDGRYVRCLLSTRNAQFPEYPHTPLTSCAGYRRRDP